MKKPKEIKKCKVVFIKNKRDFEKHFGIPPPEGYFERIGSAARRAWMLRSKGV
jgi:hypothetical protein